MPISPTPPSGAKTSSCCSVISGPAETKNFTRSDRAHTPALIQQQTSALIEAAEAAGKFTLGQPHPQDFAESSRPLEPSGASGCKAQLGVPLRKAFPHCGGQLLKQRVRRHGRTGGNEVGRRIGRVGRMGNTVDANADRNREDRIVLSF